MKFTRSVYSAYHGQKNIFSAVAATASLITVLVFAASFAATSNSSTVTVGATGFTCAPYNSIKATPTGNGVLYAVTNDSELNTAIASAGPGDVIELADGIYSGGLRIDGLAGTASNPVTIQAANHLGAEVRGNGSSFAIQVEEADYLNIYGLDITSGSVWTMYLGSGESGNSPGGTDYVGNVEHIVFSHNEVSGNSSEGTFPIKGSVDLPSHDVLVTCNTVHTNTGGNHSEGIYLGAGSQTVDTSYNITIQGNTLYGFGDEAIDVKRGITNVTIQDNDIYDIATGTSGAVVVGLNNIDYPDGNFLIDGNRIWNISTTSQYSDGNAISIAHGNAVIRNNIIWDVEHTAITSHSTRSSSNIGFGNAAANDIEIYNNTMWDCGLDCVRETTAPGTGVAADFTVENNISENTSSILNSSDNYIATTPDFVGPSLTGTADAGTGPGSAFALAASSGAIDSAATIAGFSIDAIGAARPQGNAWDYGALEYMSGGSGPSNNAPTDVTPVTSPITVQENNATNTHLTGFTTTDQDTTDTHTYTLQCDTPGADDSLFQIITAVGPHLGHLHTSTVFDYESPTDTGGTPNDNIYEVCVRTTDNGSPIGTYDETFMVTVTNDIGDDSSPDTTPPTIFVTGANPLQITQGSTYTDPGATATDDIDGDISDDIVINSSTVNTNVIGSYTVTYNVSDTVGNPASQETRTVEVIAASSGNTAPSAIALSSNTLAENSTANTVVGMLGTVDADSGDTHAYSLVSGVGSEDNASFTVNADNLVLPTGLDYENPTDTGGTTGDNIYYIRLQTDDGNGGTYQEAFQIYITNDTSDDIDNDGIDPDTEDSAPNSGDYNNDGTADSAQSNVATLPNPAASSNSDQSDVEAADPFLPAPTASNPTRYVSVSSPSGTTLDSVSVATEASLPAQDSTRDFPLGIFSFTMNNVSPASTQTVTITLDQDYPTTITDTWAWVKYNSADNSYTSVPSSANLTYGTTTIGADTVTTVSYDITDGGTLDEDGVANGTIVDPIGPSVLAETDTIADSGAGDTDTLEDTGVGAAGVVLVGLALVSMTIFAVSSMRVRTYKA